MYILRTDDRPTDRPRILENFERPHLGNGSSAPPHVWFSGSVFEAGGSNGATSGRTKSKMALAAGRQLSKFRMTISQQRVHRIHLMFGSRLEFSGSADRMSLLPVGPNPRPRPSAVSLSCKILNGRISERWWRGVVVNALIVINEVTLRLARLVLRRVTVCRRVNHLGM